MKEHRSCNSSILTLMVALVIFVQTNILTMMVFELKGTNIGVQEVTKDEVSKKLDEVKNWKLVIPKINVSADIKEGTDEEIINNNIGHFTNTPAIDGNIGLIAGCNRI